MSKLLCTNQLPFILLLFVFQERKRRAVIHVSNSEGLKLQGADITIKQVSKDFLIGSAVGKTIIGNERYQVGKTKTNKYVLLI